ncbi:hypothetical protein BOX15_Mlig014717g2, partial [Macrostomum lignano]
RWRKQRLRRWWRWKRRRSCLRRQLQVRRAGRERTVQKDGPNKGRPFFGCAKPMNQSCNFFQWGDEPAGGGGWWRWWRQRLCQQ